MCRNFILPETGKPCLLFCLLQFAQLIVPYPAKNVHYGDVLIKFGEYLDVKKVHLAFIPTEAVANKYKASFLQNGDIIIADTAEDETVGKCCEIANSEGNTLVSGLHTMPCRPNQKYASGFLGYYMNSPAYHDQLLPLMQGTKVTSVSKTAISDTQLIYPVSVDEQRRISQYLLSIDNLITLHQRDKSPAFLCSKITTTAWEQRKFEDIAMRLSTMSSAPELPRVEYEDIISGTGRLDKDLSKKESSKTGIEFHRGDVLYGKLRPYLRNWLLPAFSGLAVGDFWVLQPQSVDSSFLYRLIQSGQFDEVANQSTGTKMPRADWKLVSKTEFAIPQDMGEQAKIGHYFNDLDNLITLHQREVFNYSGCASI